MILKKIYRFLFRQLKPYKYMEKVGVNFPRGGSTYMEKFIGTLNHG